MQSTLYSQDMNYPGEENSLLTDTSYDTILSGMSKKSNQCFAGPVIQVPHKNDIMMHTRNCKRVHDYLNKDRWDMARLEKNLRAEFGEDFYQETKAKMEKYWGEPVKNLRDYFEMLDARVAELKHAGGGQEMIDLQRQECYILANNFIGDSDVPSKTYLSRMIIPMF